MRGNLPIITSPLIIRPFENTDYTEFLKLLDIPEVPGWGMQKEHLCEFFNWHLSNYVSMDVINGIVFFGIFDKVNGEILGAIGVGKHDDLPETELFYSILTSARRKGYATEAADAVTSWALESYNIPYLIATAASNNTASNKVLEAIGYEFIEEKQLLVHILNKYENFKVCKRYRFTKTIINWSSWGKVFQSIEAFETLIKHIFVKEGLPLTKIENCKAGTNAVFRVGGYVV